MRNWILGVWVLFIALAAGVVLTTLQSLTLYVCRLANRLDWPERFFLLVLSAALIGYTIVGYIAVAGMSRLVGSL